MIHCNFLTYIILFIILGFIIYVYTSKLPPYMENFTESLTVDESGNLYSPFCYGLSENQCVNNPGCQWTIDNNYYGSCQPQTVWYNPWYSGWYNWYNRYWSPWRWSYPYYTSYYSYPNYSYRYPRWHGGRRHHIRGGHRTGGRIGGGRIGGARMAGGRRGGGRR